MRGFLLCCFLKLIFNSPFVNYLPGTKHHPEQVNAFGQLAHLVLHLVGFLGLGQQCFDVRTCGIEHIYIINGCLACHLYGYLIANGVGVQA